MALVSVQRSPSNSNSSSTISVSAQEVLGPAFRNSHHRVSVRRQDNDDEPDFDLKRVCECFFAIKGAALILPHSTDPRPIKKHPVVGELQQHLQSIFFLLRSQDTITLAVRLESIYNTHIRYMVLVSTLGVDDTEETIILGVDLQNSHCSVGLVLPIWGHTGISMDGDGGFGVHTGTRSYIFKPVSIQAMWSAIQCLNKTCQIARNKNYIPAGLNLTWEGYYRSLPGSSTKCVYEWNLLPDTFSHFQDHMTYHEGYVEGGHFCPSERELTERYIWVKLKEIMTQVDLDSITGRYLRARLEEEMGRDLKEYKSAIDEQAMIILGQMDSASKILDFLYLGSEWNASNFVEMDKVGIRYVLNISVEIDNFFPGHFTYHNVRVLDNEQADLLRHWDETYRFISKAKETGTKAFVHCKMGISRSAATVIAFVMKDMGWSLDRAFKYVKERRKIVQPNPAFMEQLLEYQGILDASKQRHNALWRSKSESSLSTCESLENLSSAEVFNSSEELKDLSASQRRRSWSPDDSTANALLNYPDPSGISYAGEMYLRNPSPTSEGHLADEEEGYSSEDECSEIHIPVPSIQPGPSTAPDPKKIPEPVEGGSEELHGAMGGVEPEEEGNAEISSPHQEKERLSEKLSPESESEKLLNTNNNSATNLDLKNGEKDVKLDIKKKTVDEKEENEEEEVAVVVDVKERISTIENQISRLDSTGSPEKSLLESPLLEELPTDTVRRRKEKLEQKIKGNLAEDDDEYGEDEVDTFTTTTTTPERASAEVSETNPTVPPSTEDSPESEKMDTDIACRNDISSIKGDLFQRKDQSPLEAPPVQYSSPSLANVEPGSVQKSKEKFQSWQTKGWKSPTFGQDSYIMFESLKHTKPPGNSEIEPGNGALPESSEETTVTTDQTLTVESNKDPITEASQIPSSVSSGAVEVADKDTSSEAPGAVVEDEDTIGKEEKMEAEVDVPSDPNTFILHATGEEIPLQPGTVKRQTQGFEQLHLEGSEKSNKISSADDSNELKEEMEVTVEDVESGDGKERETPSQSEEKRVEAVSVEADSDSSKDTSNTAVGEKSGDEEAEQREDDSTKKMEVDEERIDINELSSPPTQSQDADVKEGPSEQDTWKPGSVKKHTEELEKKSAESTGNLPGLKKSPKVCSESAEASLSSDQLQAIRDLGKIILGKDGSVKEGEDTAPEEGTKEAIPSEAVEATQEVKESEEDYVNVLEMVRTIELKRCSSIASMSSEKVASKYRKRSAKDGSRGERSPAKDREGVGRDSPVTSKQLDSDHSSATERETLVVTMMTDLDAEVTNVRTEIVQKEDTEKEEKTNSVTSTKELIGEEAVSFNTVVTQSRLEMKQNEIFENDGAVDKLKQNSETGSRLAESDPVAKEGDSGIRDNLLVTGQGDVAQLTHENKAEISEAKSESVEEGKEEGKASHEDTFKRDSQIPPLAMGKVPQQVKLPSVGEKKPYGPTHPLARLRKTSSGKHPFYSTM